MPLECRMSECAVSGHDNHWTLQVAADEGEPVENSFVACQFREAHDAVVVGPVIHEASA